MTTTVYLIRHAQPEYMGYTDSERPLTPKGWSDVPKVTQYLWDKSVDIVFASPFKRAVDTIGDFCSKSGLEMHIVEDFREVNIGEDFQGEFLDTVKHLWTDFDYALSDGESYGAVQRRCVAALQEVLQQCAGKTIVVAMHSTAMSTILQHYMPNFGWEDYLYILGYTPYVSKITFEKDQFLGVEYKHFEN